MVLLQVDEDTPILKYHDNLATCIASRLMSESDLNSDGQALSIHMRKAGKLHQVFKVVSRLSALAIIYLSSQKTFKISYAIGICKTNLDLQSQHRYNDSNSQGVNIYCQESYFMKE